MLIYSYTDFRNRGIEVHLIFFLEREEVFRLNLDGTQFIDFSWMGLASYSWWSH